MDKIKVFDGCFNPIKHIKNDDIFIVLTPEEKNVLMVTREKFNEVVPDTANENNKLTDKEYVDGIKTELDTDIATINSKIPSTASNTNKLTDKLYVDELVAAEQSRAENVEDLLDRSIDHEVERATTKETLLENAITIINSKIPSTATDTNKLVDKDFVDSIIDDINDSIDIIDEVTAEGLYNLNERKQDIIEDLETIRSGAALGETAYQKPLNGIPASDIANGVIPDVSQFITKSVNDLVNYYTKSLTYTQSEVNALIGSIQQFHYEIYPSLQDITTPATNVLYLIGPTGSGSDKYEEYVYANNSFTKIGDTTIDLSGYVTIQALNTALADYVTSTDLTTLLSGKQDTLVSGTNIKTINSQSVLGSGNLDVKDVFIVEYNVTTYQEILDAYNAGKHLVLKYSIYGNPDDWRLLPLENVVMSRDGASAGTYSFTFSAIYNNYSFSCAIDIFGYSQTITNLQEKLTFDNTPTANSDNPVKSSGVKTALDAKQDKIDRTHKLNADLVDDSSTTHKFITTAERTLWNTVTDKAPLPFVVICGIDPSNVSFVNSTLDEIWEAYRNNKTIRVNFAKAGGVSFEDDATLLLDGSRNCVVHTVHNGTHYTITIYEDNGVTKLSYAETHDSDKQDVISDLSTIRSGAAKGATAYQKPSGGIPESDLTSELQQAIDNVPSILQSISAISDLVPEQASSSNQLADKNFVNSSIQTNTAEFKGTRNLVTDLSLTTSATQQQIATALASAISSADNNDYCFVQIPTSDATPTQIARVDRYKYNGNAWLFEWSLNNSSFTAEQWAAINSTVTSGDVDKLRLLPTKAQLDTLFAAKQNTLISGTNIKTINSNSILGSGNLDVKDIFIVEYEVTTYQDVVNAYNAGKYLILKYSLPSMSEDYRLLLLEDVTISIDGVTQGTYSFTFSAISGTRSYSVHLTTNGYEPDITYVLQTELTFDNAPTANSYNPVISWGIKNALDAKQDKLVSGTNIKTINNTSVLGSGTIDVQPKIDSTHKLDADLIDDSNSNNKFVTITFRQF